MSLVGDEVVVIFRVSLGGRFAFSFFIEFLFLGFEVCGGFGSHGGGVGNKSLV